VRELVWKAPQDGDGARDALARLGVESVLGKLPSELSQGERKLVGVARALAAAPSVVCLDEPAPGSTRPRANSSGAACARWLTAGRGCFWSTTTWASC
jgi:ABC-type branched-subunit amino acid transport system ATPase component